MCVNSTIHIRPALRHEARTIAKLFLISSDGLAAYIWQQAAGPDELLLAVGAKRYARSGVPFSYENCLVAERAGRVIGMAHAFAMEDGCESERHCTSESDPVLRPYSELEDPGSLYLSGLAVFPAARGQGIGKDLLDAALERARSLGLPRLSLICFEANTGACRFYRRHGFDVVNRRPLVPHPLLHYSDGDALLMATAVDRPLRSEGRLRQGAGRGRQAQEMSVGA